MNILFKTQALRVPDAAKDQLSILRAALAVVVYRTRADRGIEGTTIYTICTQEYEYRSTGERERERERHIYIYIYIYRERERERRERERHIAISVANDIYIQI